MTYLNRKLKDMEQVVVIGMEYIDVYGDISRTEFDKILLVICY